MRPLDCGHVDDWGGTASCRDRHGGSLCRACAHASDLATFLASEDRAFGYVSGDGKHVTSWGGGNLAIITPCSKVRRRYTPSGGMYEQQTFRARDATGRMWAGVGPGPNMYAKLKRVRNTK